MKNLTKAQIKERYRNPEKRRKDRMIGMPVKEIGLYRYIKRPIDVIN